MFQDVSAVIVAGGQATRFGGVRKEKLDVAGETIFARQLTVLAPMFAHILVASGTPRDDLAAQFVADAPGTPGPAAGVVGALSYASTPWVFAVGGDMPLLRAELIAMVVAARGTWACVVPYVHDAPQPLCALYHKTMLPLMMGQSLRSSIAAADLAGRCCWLSAEALMAADPELGSFVNLNEPADLARLRARAPAK